MRILVAEDDAPVASFVKKCLEIEQHSVDVASDGLEAQQRAVNTDYDLMVLDLGLPLADGLEVLEWVRNRKPHLPVLVLTGRNRVEDRVKGLDLGADDYLCKPFAMAELAARVRALSRRGHTGDVLLTLGDLEVDLVTHTAKRAGRPLDLTNKEFALLEYLMRHAGHPVSREMIVAHVWKLPGGTMTNVVDVYINYLRHKVDDHFEHKLIHTARGVGYRLALEEEKQVA